MRRFLPWAHALGLSWACVTWVGCFQPTEELEPRCLKVTCESPPAADCVEGSVRTYASVGECQPLTGECLYPSTTAACPSSTPICQAGTCVSSCQVAGCRTPPASDCLNGKVRVYSAEGVCDENLGTCTYSSALNDCPTETPACQGGRCVNRCVNVDCSMMPTTCADELTLKVPVGQATCDPMDGSCYAVTQLEACPEGTSCRSGECRAPGPLKTIEVTPSALSLPSGGIHTFTASGKDALGNAVELETIDWSADVLAGAITDGGVFTASQTLGTYSQAVVATSKTIQGYATVTVVDPCSVVTCAPPSTQCLDAVTVERQYSTCFAGVCSENTQQLGCTAGLSCHAGICGVPQWTEYLSTLPPSARQLSAMVYVAANQRILLFGGKDVAGNALQDTWEWNGTKWIALAPNTSPSARYGHAMAYDAARQVVVLFGGENSTGRLDDTWEWDGVTWNLVATSGPSARHGHRMVYHSLAQSTLLFAGESAAGPENDLWKWNGSIWTALTVDPDLSSSQGAPGRRNFGMTYDSARNVVVVFGGQGLFDVPVSDTWELTGTSTFTWVFKNVGSAPPASETVVMGYDMQRTRAVVFGGKIAGNYTDTTWEWSGSSWLQKTLSPRPPARAFHAMAYDLARQSLMVFGGLDAQLRNDTWGFY